MAGIYRRGATTTDEIIDFVAGTELGSDQIYIGYMGSDLLWGKVVFVDNDPARIEETTVDGAPWKFGYSGSDRSLRQQDLLYILPPTDVATGIKSEMNIQGSSSWGVAAEVVLPVAGADYTMTVDVGDVVNTLYGGTLLGWIGGLAAYNAGISTMTPLVANATNVVSGSLAAGETTAVMLLTMETGSGDYFILETSSIQAGDWFNYYTPGVIVYANEPADFGSGWDIAYAGPYEDTQAWLDARTADVANLSIDDSADGVTLTATDTITGPYGIANSAGLTLIPAVAPGEIYTATVDIGDVVAVGGGVLKGAMVGVDDTASLFDLTGTTLTANATNKFTCVPDQPYMYLMVWLTEFIAGDSLKVESLRVEMGDLT